MRCIDERGFANFGVLICILLSTPVVGSAQQIYDKLNQHQEISLFVESINKAELGNDLNSKGPYTVFAPTNEALASIKDRIKQAEKPWARRFVLNHILTGMATKRQIVAMSKAPTMGGLVLSFSQDQNHEVFINKSTDAVRIIKPNIRAGNGVIHFIDGSLEQH